MMMLIELTRIPSVAPLPDLDAQVHDKKQTVDKNTEELASLEARIREMEERLRRSAPGSSRTPLPQVQAAKGTDQESQQQPQSDSLDASSKDDAKARSRPGTARAAQQAPSSGNMPPTPGASEGEYYVVTHADLRDGPR
ncbi:Spc7 domain [Fusarium albosuccineum]|uniref:Spc7 domain n=1 Tax=Fusarium albosuccineum TaxID=1237068 RepID=A0A8H4L482_9HYPO|nr:Spc7 domain [Fusarium albosuccineum]